MPATAAPHAFRTPRHLVPPRRLPRAAECRRRPASPGPRHVPQPTARRSRREQLRAVAPRPRGVRRRTRARQRHLPDRRRVQHRRQDLRAAVPHHQRPVGRRATTSLRRRRDRLRRVATRHERRLRRPAAGSRDLDRHQVANLRGAARRGAAVPAARRRDRGTDPAPRPVAPRERDPLRRPRSSRDRGADRRHRLQLGCVDGRLRRGSARRLAAPARRAPPPRGRRPLRPALDRRLRRHGCGERGDTNAADEAHEHGSSGQATGDLVLARGSTADPRDRTRPCARALRAWRARSSLPRPRPCAAGRRGAGCAHRHRLPAHCAARHARR
jgi:hypothetical protein